MKHSHTPRRGYTLLEILVVMVILVILASVVIPSSGGLYGNTRPKAAADQIRGELAAARAWAIEDGVPYRVAISKDGTRIKRAAESEFDQQASSQPGASAKRVEYAFEKVIAEVEVNGVADQASPGSDSWQTIVVMMPNGTCRDDGAGNALVSVAVREEGQTNSAHALRVTVRLLTGQVRVTNGPKAGTQQ